MFRIAWRNRRFFAAEIEPGKGAFSGHWLWTLYLRGEIVATGYAAGRSEAIAAAEAAADATPVPVRAPEGAVDQPNFAR